MSATNFKTENNTFRKLIGNGLSYRIPRFQRDYSWGSDEWEDLWSDIMDILQENSPSHYMGYLVLQSSDDKTFDVIDGQQRLTTLNLIILAVLKNIQRLIDAGNESEANTQRLNQIRQTYIGYLDPVTLVARPKLTLNRNNNSYFQYHLVPLGHLPQRRLRASEHLLRKSFEWFDRKIANHLKQESGGEGRRLAQLVEKISDALFFTVITVTDELNAYKVFETLNARGVRLSSTDLLKNYLFSLLDRGGETDHEITDLENRWEAIVGNLQSEKFPDFLRIHWNSRNNFARQADLFKIIRAKITDRESVFCLLRGMEEDLDTYLALSSPEGSNWPQEDKINAGILKTFRVRQPFPLLLAAKRSFSPNDFSDLLRATVVISLRYNVIGTQSTAEQERVYNAAAEKIANNELQNLSPALQALRGIYIDDKRFQADFSEKTIRTTDSRNNRVARFILCALEKHLSGQDYSFISDAFNIEHILPQSAPDGWGGFSNEEADSMIYRLGNMTLMKTSENNDAGNEAYHAKREKYRKSGFAITRKLAEEYAEWTPANIAAWQAWMARQATSIWRIAQLS
ncbi:DUF262 domain-containing protein [Vandammella animalimorsus]|uniref:DUF262 domain-containing protein n=1 Tax=Vandammella animalimorsus TaxID=2029117 RepID=A0A2A2ALA1_9BURK|nr:DUF262 domain-containing protein [Vandammella animalimorsus]PAT38557.1 hypothetical protein CK625_03545 [Vandammella animalimorsus]